MAKKTYETPVADLLTFDYTAQVTANSGGGDASHCTGGRNPGGCMGKGYGNCGGYTSNPGGCNNN
ncbi:MAG: hypothetical protein K6F61_05770 [Clostridiales bacterium]|nr:hypothetical protein [Clostridia bacterium]MCR5566339.1 hypothetical protein [Clostridiales bacterium]